MMLAICGTARGFRATLFTCSWSSTGQKRTLGIVQREDAFGGYGILVQRHRNRAQRLGLPAWWRTGGRLAPITMFVALPIRSGAARFRHLFHQLGGLPSVVCQMPYSFAQPGLLGPLGGVLQQSWGNVVFIRVLFDRYLSRVQQTFQLPGAAARCCLAQILGLALTLFCLWTTIWKLLIRLSPPCPRDVAGFAGFWVTLAGMNHDLSLHQRRRAPTSEVEGHSRGWHSFSQPRERALWFPCWWVMPCPATSCAASAGP